MKNKKTISQIKKHWQAYELASPYGVETILFKDLEECRSPETRARYVDMLAMFLEQFDDKLENSYRGSYHYKIKI